MKRNSNDSRNVIYLQFGKNKDSSNCMRLRVGQVEVDGLGDVYIYPEFYPDPPRMKEGKAHYRQLTKTYLGQAEYV